MDKWHDTVLETLMEQLIEGGAENMGLVFARVFDLAMQIERERFLGAPALRAQPVSAGLRQWLQGQADRYARGYSHGQRAQNGRT